MKNFYVPPQFEVVRDPQRCVNCKVCVEQCPNGVHRFDETHNRMLADESKCVDCQRCVAYCPTHALKIEKNRCTLRESANCSSCASAHKNDQKSQLAAYICRYGFLLSGVTTVKGPSINASASPPNRAHQRSTSGRRRAVSSSVGGWGVT